MEQTLLHLRWFLHISNIRVNTLKLQYNTTGFDISGFYIAVLTVNIRTQIVAYFFENELNLGLGRRRVVSHPTWMICCTYSQQQVANYNLLILIVASKKSIS